MDQATLKRSFLTFLVQNMTVSHAQLCQDLFVLWALGVTHKGVFFEAGAFDGVKLSNTYLLERLGWSGLLVEPIPDVFARLKKARSCAARQAALTSDAPGEADLRISLKGAELTRLEAVVPDDKHERSGLRDRFELVTVPTVRIGDALREAHLAAPLDYVSLDTEGNEFELLTTFPFSEHRPKVFSIEHNNSPRQREIDGVLKANGYRRVFAEMTAFDGWYLDEAAFEALLSRDPAPPPALEPGEMPVAPSSAARKNQLFFTRPMARNGMQVEAEALLDRFADGPRLADRVAQLRAAIAPEEGGEEPDVPRPAEPSSSAPSPLEPSPPAPPSDAPLQAVIAEARRHLQSEAFAEAERVSRAGALAFGDSGALSAILVRAIYNRRREEGQKPNHPKGSDRPARIRVAEEGAGRIDRSARVKNAGKVETDATGRWQVMHNGVRVPADGYYGVWMTDLIARCGGYHEPQEETVFDAVLKRLPKGARMIELGAFWAFYTASFLCAQAGTGRAIMVEPEDENLLVGLQTLNANGVSAGAIRGRVGGAPMEGRSTRFGAKLEIPEVNVPSLVEREGWDHLHILHADIQGGEVALMGQIDALLAARKISYLFVSTHGFRHHIACLKAVMKHDYRLIAEHDMAESYSQDGLVAARAPNVVGPGYIDLPRRGV